MWNMRMKVDCVSGHLLSDPEANLIVRQYSRLKSTCLMRCLIIGKACGI